MKKAVIRLNYLPANEADDSMPAQPCILATLDGKGIRVVPITPNQRQSCDGCVVAIVSVAGSCGDIPNCDNAIYVRATPTNKLKYVEWLLDQNN